jgi:glycosyltransferase involved in cell wall biosynthesis
VTHHTHRSAGGVRPRVLHVTHYCLPHIGGIETVVDAETRGLAAGGWDVSVLSSAFDTRAGVRSEEGVRTVRVRAWSGLEPRFGVPFPVFSPWLLVTMWREVRRADVVHVHDALYLTSWVAAFWCLVLRTPYVVHRHVGFVHHSSVVVRIVQRLVLATFAKPVLWGAAAVLPIDEFIAAGLRATMPASTTIEVLGNGVDTARFHPADPGENRRDRHDLGLPAEQPLALFVGRFVPKKGFATVAAAASDSYGLVFVGGERPAGLDDPRLHFLGGVPAAEMPRIYRSVNAMVVASVGECPLTVLEAMSSALPVLLNDDPALHSPWTAGPGVRFVDMAAGHLADALHDLLADGAVAASMGVEGHRYVLGAFSWDAHVDQLERVYRDVLAEAVSDTR